MILKYGIRFNSNSNGINIMLWVLFIYCTAFYSKLPDKLKILGEDGDPSVVGDEEEVDTL